MSNFNERNLIEQASITIEQCKKNRAETGLFVMNTSDLEGKSQRGEIQFRFMKRGQVITVSIPDTWIPFDISQYISKEDALDDNVFVRHINRKYISIMDPNIAREILKSEDAYLELKRIADRQNKVNEAISGISASNSMNNAELEEARNRFRNASTTEAGRVESGSQTKTRELFDINKIPKLEGENFKVISIMRNTTLNENDKLGALRNIKHELKSEDWDFIMQNCPNDMPKIKTFVLDNK